MNLRKALGAILLAILMITAAQAATTLAPTIRQRFFDLNGLPLAGGLLYSYQAGTSTPLATYSNQGGSTNANPVVLDSQGYADVWLTPGVGYKIVLKDSTSSTQWTTDNVVVPFTSGVSTSLSTAALLLYPTVGASTYVTVTAPSGVATYGLSLPAALPAANSSFVVASTGGALSFLTVDNSTTAVSGSSQVVVKNSGITATQLATDAVTTAKILASNVTTAKIADNNVTFAKRAVRGTGGTAALGDVAFGSSTSTYFTANTTFTDAGTSVTITTDGGPVIIQIVPDGSSNPSYFGGDAAIQMGILRDNATYVSVNQSSAVTLPPGSVAAYDQPSAGSHSYKLQVAQVGGGTYVRAYYLKIIAFQP